MMMMSHLIIGRATSSAQPRRSISPLRGSDPCSARRIISLLDGDVRVEARLRRRRGQQKRSGQRGERIGQPGNDLRLVLGLQIDAEEPQQLSEQRRLVGQELDVYRL